VIFGVNISYLCLNVDCKLKIQTLGVLSLQPAFRRTGCTSVRLLGIRAAWHSSWLAVEKHSKYQLLPQE